MSNVQPLQAICVAPDVVNFVVFSNDFLYFLIVSFIQIPEDKWPKVITSNKLCPKRYNILHQNFVHKFCLTKELPN